MKRATLHAACLAGLVASVVLPGFADAQATVQGRPGDRVSARARLARLSAALADDDVQVRLKAVSELTSVGGTPAAAALARAALFDGAEAVREEAIYGLAEVGHETALPILGQALLDPDPGVREAAVEALADIGGDAAARALAFALHDEDAALREEVVFALGEIGGEIVVGILQQALTDEQEFVRDAAAEVLADLKKRER